MVTTFKLCSDSSVASRTTIMACARETVITAAGNLKRAGAWPTHEMVLLLRALQDVNTPSLLRHGFAAVPWYHFRSIRQEEDPLLGYGALMANIAATKKVCNQ